ncbi:MAG TPA: hypothetical protein VMZ91_10270 [Candidatus Paceibacterota bacterium]|nr:hypothetical protein [Candidatus Paceibacterota bacterium]
MDLEIPLKDYILLYLFYFNNENKGVRLGDVRFWCITILLIGAGFKITDGKEIWTVKGCFEELEEIWDKKTNYD